jgi:prophage regulatory protein
MVRGCPLPTKDIHVMTRKMDGHTDIPVSPAPSLEASRTPRVLRLKEVCRMICLGRSFIYQLQGENRFPRRIKIGKRAVGWLDDDVRKWLADRIADSRRNEPDPS